MALVYMGLGTNLGDKVANLNEALDLLSGRTGKVLRVSSFHSSAPWGFASANNFLNAVALIETALSPTELLKEIKAIERHSGRTVNSSGRYADRVIDLDILLYDKLVIDLPELKIPHPFLAERDFVLIPLAEIAPDVVHPVLLRKIKDLIRT